MVELLSPAGNFEKMKTAFLYGADAVYLAYNRFGMRAAADNFTLEELNEAIGYAHSLGKKIYITLNTMPREYEYPELREFLQKVAVLENGAPDAAIVADIGVMMMVRELLPKTELHISTQSGVVSSANAKAWQMLGATRVVLARELSFDEIREKKYSCGIGNRGVYSRLHVRILLRQMLAFQCARRQRCQPRRVRTALPLELYHS